MITSQNSSQEHQDPDSRPQPNGSHGSHSETVARQIPDFRLKFQHLTFTVLLVATQMVWSGQARASSPSRPVSPPSETIQTTPIRQNACSVSLAQSLDEVLNNRHVGRSRWGILVETLNGQKVLYSHNADQYFIPASNIKLLTTVAALRTWNSQQRVWNRPLHRWVEVVNLYSDNGYADALLRTLGGPSAAQQTLALAGIDPLSYRLIDGSGLSRFNMAQPSIFIKTLRVIHQSPDWQTFYQSLPVAGVKGTLRYRLADPLVKGKVHAKTGTLWGVRALSGYMNHMDYGPLVFSILANEAHASGHTLLQTIDEIVVRVAQHRPCSETIERVTTEDKDHSH